MMPVYKVIDYSDNRYLLCKAVMKRARQINFLGDDNLEVHKGKIVSIFEEIKKNPKAEGTRILR